MLLLYIISVALPIYDSLPIFIQYLFGYLIVLPIMMAFLGSIFFGPFFVITRELKSWSKNQEIRRMRSEAQRRRVGPRGGVYTNEVSRSGRSYRRYF